MNTTPPTSDVKKAADEVIALVEQSAVEHIVRFLGMAGQKITSKDAENILAKIGLRIALRNGQFANGIPPQITPLPTK